ncbi:myosin heavy chain, cardiac muscle isoform-like isoform X2 [Neltuma alba]|uniref:myosin heavy chain, cardiac muscle isoform-like isoform X2 n=1 Tax=Neltuma alba TaxID=207710 RepID=UPI0010A4F9F8|nr:myosin heavy chain, cardiac muscle isoform-like isoform X2 [Prosopis alba]XP_028790974.1 myosin heavy chain, cardiac muscle isoform-like isoform X2 [Prosopis alba]
MRFCRLLAEKANLVVMGEKEISGFDMNGSDNKSGDTVYPLYFGVSCALFALQVLSKPRFEIERWCEIRNIMLQGSARLLGLLVWKVQKQSPDGGDCELRSAKREIENLRSLRHEDAKANEKVVSIFATQEQNWLSERKMLHQHIGALMNELRILEKKKEEAASELNKKLKEMEVLVESKDKVLKEEEQKGTELEEKLTEAERNAEELRENAKREIQEHSSGLWKQKTAFIGKLLEQKEESEMMIQKLSMEVSELHKELERKGRILSAMLKKAKLDAAEKQMLIKEAKLSKARRKQAERETEKWRAVTGGRYKRHSLRSMLVRLGSTRLQHVSKEPKHFSHLSDHYLPKSYEESDITGNGKHLEEWVKAEAQNYAAMIEQRHQLELEAFAEELSNKAEKIEAFQWQLLRMELETKKLQSHVRGLIKDVAQLRHDKMKLETTLLERDKELTSPKEKLALQLKSPDCFKHNLLLPSQSSERAEDAIWSEIKRKSVEKEQEMKEISMVEYCEKEALSAEMEDSLVQKRNLSEVDLDAAENIASTSQSSNETSHFPWKMDLYAVGVFYKIKRLKQQLVLVDRLIGRQARGGEKEINDDSNIDMKIYLSLTSVLNKQVQRYQSLQEKMDNLCKLMMLYIVSA